MRRFPNRQTAPMSWGGKTLKTDAIYSFETLKMVPIPFENVEVFMQEKWRVAGDRAGSGNTANIGSINGTIADFAAGRGIFRIGR